MYSVQCTHGHNQNDNLYAWLLILTLLHHDGGPCMVIGYLTFHRRRINTEENAKVVAAAWGMEFIKFLAPLTILQQDDFEVQDEFFESSWCNSSYYSKLSYRQNSKRSKKKNKFCLPDISDDLCQSFCIYLSSMILSYCILTQHFVLYRGTALFVPLHQLSVKNDVGYHVLREELMSINR